MDFPATPHCDKRKSPSPSALIPTPPFILDILRHPLSVKSSLKNRYFLIVESE
jgi:hypothetical protein